MITYDKMGGRRIELFLPFTYKDKEVKEITLAPITLGHALRWQQGDWKSSITMLADLAGVDEEVIKELRYPDADRVLAIFLDMLPPEVRDDVTAQRIPQKVVVDDIKPPAEIAQTAEPAAEESPEPADKPTGSKAAKPRGKREATPHPPFDPNDPWKNLNINQPDTGVFGVDMDH